LKTTYFGIFWLTFYGNSHHTWQYILIMGHIRPIWRMCRRKGYYRGAAHAPVVYAYTLHCFWSDAVELTAAERARPITDTDSVLCALEDPAFLFSL